VVVLLTAALLPWLGVLQSLPHTHSDAAVPREHLVCSASGPTSHEVHLHGAGHVLPPHPCLACLAGASHAASPPPVKMAWVESTAPFVAEQEDAVRSRSSVSLPLLRGPPLAA
jgi:hypothetical protein